MQIYSNSYFFELFRIYYSTTLGTATKLNESFSIPKALCASLLGGTLPSPQPFCNIEGVKEPGMF